MNFANAISSQPTRTTNGMLAHAGTGNDVLDLFYQIGASRGKDISNQFKLAFKENKELALRVAQWARDVRGGSGERDLFRAILRQLETLDPESAVKLMTKIPEVGRFDDLFIDHATPAMQTAAFEIVGAALAAKNGLAAKWTPRKGKTAERFRAFLGLTPKQYRRLIVDLSTTVEQKMCAQDWTDINYSHVPSRAANIYKKAFARHDEHGYTVYTSKLASGDKSVKVNASAIFPHDVIKDIYRGQHASATALNLITAQWEALPNYVGDKSVLAMVDVSGSMETPAGGSGAVTCKQVAMSLGLYTADKNSGAFKDCFLNFSTKPKIHRLTGNIVDKLNNMDRSQWDMSTNIEGAFTEILRVAIAGKVAQEDMPETLLILSDMQFNSSWGADKRALDLVRSKFAAAGYKTPQVVFWNLNHKGNAPATVNDAGVALVSGFSPAILASILGANPDEFSPLGMMLKAIMSPRYDI